MSVILIDMIHYLLLFIVSQDRYKIPLVNFVLRLGNLLYYIVQLYIFYGI